MRAIAATMLKADADPLLTDWTLLVAPIEVAGATS
jgi:hypothetical protein